jgi:hypothetical protein
MVTSNYRRSLASIRHSSKLNNARPFMKITVVLMGFAATLFTKLKKRQKLPKRTSFLNYITIATFSTLEGSKA